MTLTKLLVQKIQPALPDSPNHFLFLPPAATKSSDAAPAAAKKPPAAKAKKPDKSIWDSDSDTASKNPAPALKGNNRAAPLVPRATRGSTGLTCTVLCPGKGRGRKRKDSGSEEDYSPVKKMAKAHGKVSVLERS